MKGLIKFPKIEKKHTQLKIYAMVAKKVVGAKRKVADSAEDATDYPNVPIPPMMPVNMCVEDGERSRPKRAKRKAIKISDVTGIS